MTNDEALKILPDMKGAGDDWDKAINLAIEALQRETSGDAIDRQAAIRIASIYCHSTKVAKELARLPSVQPVDKDINVPCKDAISRKKAIDYCYQLINVEHQQGSDEMNYGQVRVDQTETILHHLEFMPSVQPEPLSDAYMKAVWTWLLDYQIKAAELKGRYTPYEVLSWVANDWRKEHDGSD